MLRGSAWLAAVGLFGFGCTVDVTIEGAEGLTPVVATGLDASLLSVETAGGFIGNTFGLYAVRR